ncbi:GNAT family N-acetyltransferase [Companilactobacillus hulinensis]|uniref:GNAT family N-acetyltransferase n=1 Tax=Companilactobacillus hulinensis TaxID=2486007 RepID=UPI000F77D397|nr:GNAT family N-acetyltransferase [Companilactobacillus hulinensis]
MSIKLQKYNKKIITQSMIDGYDLSVNDNIGGPNSIIDRSNYNSNMHPIMILNDDQLVGCFCLHVKDGPLAYGGDYETDILVRAFSIDVRFRRNGYALAALLELSDFVKDNYSSIERIILAVNHDNIAAQALYSKAGFVDTGKRTDSHLGKIYIFNKSVL